MLSLFRLIDINAGSIMLDNVDTSSIALDALRKQLAIIPQVGRQSCLHQPAAWQLVGVGMEPGSKMYYSAATYMYVCMLLCCWLPLLYAIHKAKLGFISRLNASVVGLLCRTLCCSAAP